MSDSGGSYKELEKHKWRCLAREVLRMPLEERRLFIERWEKRHGVESAKQLRGGIRSEWEKRR